MKKKPLMKKDSSTLNVFTLESVENPTYKTLDCLLYNFDLFIMNEVFGQSKLWSSQKAHEKKL